MRIRKRLVPSSPLPLADPQLINQSLVVQLPPQTTITETFQECTTNYQPSDPPNQPSDQRMKIPDGIAQWVSNPKDLEGELINKDDKISNDVIKKECTLNAGVDVAFLLSASSSEQDRKWDDGDKEIPLKKRKQSRGFERINMKAKWKSKTNKKCLRINGIIDNDEGADSGVHGGRKKGRGVDIMEGSRCSRVNGRGWRCCQPTLVGYSLCDHHLGKGRLRSMSSVTNHAVGTRNTTSKTRTIGSQSVLVSQMHDDADENQEDKELLSSMAYDEDGNDVDDGDEEKPKRVVIRKKTKKLGMVKARSMSSLLCQLDSTNKAVVVEANDMKMQ